MGKFLKENPSPYPEEYKDDVVLREYFSNLALRYLSLIKLHRENKHLPSLKNLSPDELDTNISTSGKGDWSGVIRHCLAEAGAVDGLAVSLHLSEMDRDTLIQAAILHDFDKKVEIEALRNSSGNHTEVSEKMKLISKKVLEEKGVKPEIIAIIGEIGDTHIMQKDNINLLQKILFYIDNITEGTNLVSVKTKYENLLQRYPKLADEGAYDDWLSSTEQVQKELAEKVGLQNPEELPNFILQKVRKLATGKTAGDIV